MAKVKLILDPCHHDGRDAGHPFTEAPFSRRSPIRCKSASPIKVYVRAASKSTEHQGKSIRLLTSSTAQHQMSDQRYFYPRQPTGQAWPSGSYAPQNYTYTTPPNPGYATLNPVPTENPVTMHPRPTQSRDPTDLWVSRQLEFETMGRNDTASLPLNQPLLTHQDRCIPEYYPGKRFIDQILMRTSTSGMPSDRPSGGTAIGAEISKTALEDWASYLRDSIFLCHFWS